MPSKQLVEDYEREKTDFAIKLRKELEVNIIDSKAAIKAKKKLLSTIAKDIALP